jgi:hypothetical protein
MLDSRLILVEGFPGAGKSTTTEYIGSILQQSGMACRWFLEDDDPHPIACLDFEIKGLTQKMVPLWTRLSQQAMQDPAVTVIESRLWQNTALFMYMSECGLEEIFEFNRQVCQVLTPLSPVLVYLDQEDVEAALRRLYAIRGEKWMDQVLETTTQYAWFQSRSRKDFAAWVDFFKEWQDVAGRLFADWSTPKIKIQNPHDDWERAYNQLHAFLQIEYIRQ